MTIVFDGQTKIEGDVIGWEEYWLIDLAVVKVKMPSGASPLEFAPTDTVNVGDSVVDLGFPLSSLLGAELSASEGIVSSKREVADGFMHIQTSAAINPGDSGGLLMSTAGGIVGVSAYGWERTPDGRIVEGIKFAVSSDVVQTVLPDLMKGYRAGEILVTIPAGEFSHLKFGVG